MGYAKKCDRCGAYYDKNVISTEGRIIGGYLDVIRTFDTGGDMDQEFDLCNNCWFDFTNSFMKNKEATKQVLDEKPPVDKEPEYTPVCPRGYADCVPDLNYYCYDDEDK